MTDPRNLTDKATAEAAIVAASPAVIAWPAEGYGFYTDTHGIRQAIRGWDGSGNIKSVQPIPNVDSPDFKADYDPASTLGALHTTVKEAADALQANIDAVDTLADQGISDAATAQATADGEPALRKTAIKNRSDSVYLEDFDPLAGTYTIDLGDPDKTYDDAAFALAYAEATAQRKRIAFLGKQYVFKDPVVFDFNCLMIQGAGPNSIRLWNYPFGTRLTSILATGVAFQINAHVNISIRDLSFVTSTTGTGVFSNMTQLCSMENVDIETTNDPDYALRLGMFWQCELKRIHIRNGDATEGTPATYGTGVGLYHDTLNEISSGGNNLLKHVRVAGYDTNMMLGQETATISPIISWRQAHRFDGIECAYGRRNLVIGSGYRNIRFSACWFESGTECDVKINNNTSNITFENTMFLSTDTGVANVILGDPVPGSNEEIGSMTFNTCTFHGRISAIRIHPTGDFRIFPDAVHKLVDCEFMRSWARVVVSDRVPRQVPLVIQNPILRAGILDRVPRLGYDSTSADYGTMVQYNDYIVYKHDGKKPAVEYDPLGALAEAERYNWWLAPQDAATTWSNRGTVAGSGTLSANATFNTSGTIANVGTVGSASTEVIVTFPSQAFDFTPTGKTFFAMSFKWNGVTHSLGTGPRFIRGLSGASDPGIDFYLNSGVPYYYIRDGVNTDLQGQTTNMPALSTGVDYVLCLTYQSRTITANIYNSSGVIVHTTHVDTTPVGNFTPLYNPTINGYGDNWIEGEIGDIIIHNVPPMDEKSLARAMALRTSAPYSILRKQYEISRLIEPATAITDLNQTISATYVDTEVQALSDKVDEALAAFRTAGLIAST